MPSRSTSLCLAAALSASVVAGCGGSDSTSTSSTGPTTTTAQKVDASGAKVVKLTLNDGACAPNQITTPAGPTTFEVTGGGTKKGKEIYFLDGTRVLGEIEQVDPGQTGKITLNLAGGDFDLSCNNPGLESNGSLTVTGSNAAAESLGAAEKTAAEAYRQYLTEQTSLLTKQTIAFADAVKAGDMAKAKALYGLARVPYERVEPVAESFGDLDPKIDAREGDVPLKQQTGFHVIEKALYKNNTLKGMKPFADKLVADVKQLETLVKDVPIDPVQTANGAVELLNEVSKSKITGEEERFSGIDLLDFHANVQGAQSAYDIVAPILKTKDGALASTVSDRFSALYKRLDAYKQGSGFVQYSTLDKADKTKLSQSVDSLAEPLSQVPAHVVG
ncbi:MAG: iron uptake system component EfeO [Solirubrobacteraceae bacterium]|jgi:iron uptake system component EfeO|nr:iron uptake system component EfeO [Solirubrobacteraceae bacterium]